MKKLRKGCAAFVLTMVLVMSTYINTGAITTITRTNVDENGTKVSGAYTTNFTVTVKQEEDSIDIFQIATMECCNGNLQYRCLGN